MLAIFFIFNPLSCLLAGNSTTYLYTRTCLKPMPSTGGDRPMRFMIAILGVINVLCRTRTDCLGTGSVQVRRLSRHTYSRRKRQETYILPVLYNRY
jgi:hypothetical protein